MRSNDCAIGRETLCRHHLVTSSVYGHKQGPNHSRTDGRTRIVYVTIHSDTGSRRTCFSSGGKSVRYTGADLARGGGPGVALISSSFLFLIKKYMLWPLIWTVSSRRTTHLNRFVDTFNEWSQHILLKKNETNRGKIFWKMYVHDCTPIGIFRM